MRVDARALADIDSVTSEALPLAMIAVPAGAFVMGDGVSDRGTDEHEVTMTRDFYLGRHEVSNQEYLEAVQWAYDHGYVTAPPARCETTWTEARRSS